MLVMVDPPRPSDVHRRQWDGEEWPAHSPAHSPALDMGELESATVALGGQMMVIARDTSKANRSIIQQVGLCVGGTRSINGYGYNLCRPLRPFAITLLYLTAHAHARILQ